jgi:DNA-binding SARP family transcriptional activator/tetratricopeptide (TPR) repeat protein
MPTVGAGPAQFRVWGQIAASRGDLCVELGTTRQSCVLAVLLMSAGRPVAVDSLIESVWGSRPPARVRNVLATYVTRLRAAIAEVAGDAVLRFTGGGYLVACDPGQVDRHRAGQLARRAREVAAGGGDRDADRLFAEALDLCTGEPLAALKGDWAEATRRRLLAERQAMIVDRIGVELRLGRHETLVPTLTSLVDDNPTDTRMVGWLMMALYRCGRSAEALAAYRAAREASVDQLGLEPSERLRQLERAILRDEPLPDWAPGPAQPPPAPSWPRPAQVPPAIPDFVGRADALEHLLAAATGARGAVAVVTGLAGVGKTALLTRAAHQLRAAFPDGQLFAGLATTDAASVLARFLRAFGVPAASIPDDTDERVALYRSVLADKRTLVVLDDAQDEAHVRPLLPTGAGSAALIGSRYRLPGLDAATVLYLNTMDGAEAVELLRRKVSAERIAADPAAARDVCRLCGYLPLALRVAAARLARTPGVPLASFAAELADKRGRLDLLQAGDLHVRASFALSYEPLEDAPRRLLRRLGLLETPDITARLACAVLNVPMPEARRALDELVAANLVDTLAIDAVGQPRMRVHDLVRIFARERAEAEEPVRVQKSTVKRAIRSLLATAEHIAPVTGSGFGDVHGRPLCAPPRWVPRDPPGADPIAWLEAERASLVAAVEQAAQAGLTDLAWHLCGSVVEFFDMRGYHTDWWRSHMVTLPAVERANDTLGKAVVVQGLGFLEMARDDNEAALAHLHRAAALFDAASTPVGVAQCTASMSPCLRMLGRLAESATRAEDAERIAGEADYLLGRAQARYELGATRREQGLYADAIACFEHALSLATAGGHTRAQGIILRGLGTVYARLHDYDRAAEHHERACAILAAVGDELRSGFAAHQLAETHLQRGQPDKAIPLLRECAKVFGSHGDHYGQAVSLNTWARLHTQLGRPDLAANDLHDAVQAWHRLRMPVWEARSLRDLGDIQAEIVSPKAAAATWRQALATLDGLSVPETAELTDRLTAEPATSPQ